MKLDVYMVRYTDDYNRKHIAFVKDTSSVKFLINRFENVTYEKTVKISSEDKLFFSM